MEVPIDLELLNLKSSLFYLASQKVMSEEDKVTLKETSRNIIFQEP